jgi:thioredoxin 1
LGKEIDEKNSRCGIILRWVVSFVKRRREMGVVHLSDSTFDEEVIRSSLPVLVDFWAEWCGPCMMIAPILDELAKEYEGRVKVAKINVDENREKATTYNVTSIPNMKLFKDGKVVDEIVGAVPKERIKRMIDASL